MLGSRCSFLPRFSIVVETKYEDNNGTTDNCHNLSQEEVQNRKLEFLDIAVEHVPEHKYKLSEDPTKFKSKKTGRGPLTPTWTQTFKPIMCAYKIVRVRFEVWGLQTRSEDFMLRTVRDILILAHRQAFTWMDEWYGMSMEEYKQNGKVKQLNQEDNVVDMTSRKLNDDERSILRKGLGFIPTQPLNTTKLVSKVIAGVEAGIRRKSLGEKEDIVSGVKRVLSQYLQSDKTKYYDNLPRNQRKALKKLKTDENIIVIPADKGGKVVVMDVVDYINKIQEKLDTDSYTQLNDDPSKYIHKKLQILLSELVGKGEIDEDIMETLLVDKNIPIVR
ncbi:unnamed protein product, partial [Didymodactylos carnosus]